MANPRIIISDDTDTTSSTTIAQTTPPTILEEKSAPTCVERPFTISLNNRSKEDYDAAEFFVSKHMAQGLKPEEIYSTYLSIFSKDLSLVSVQEKYQSNMPFTPEQHILLKGFSSSVDKNLGDFFNFLVHAINDKKEKSKWNRPSIATIFFRSPIEDTEPPPPYTDIDIDTDTNRRDIRYL